jgi:hypothetical protein
VCSVLQDRSVPQSDRKIVDFHLSLDPWKEKVAPPWGNKWRRSRERNMEIRRASLYLRAFTLYVSPLAYKTGAKEAKFVRHLHEAKYVTTSMNMKYVYPRRVHISKIAAVVELKLFRAYQNKQLGSRLDVGLSERA